MWGAECFAPNPPSSPPRYSSILCILQGLYLSVAFIHNPRDLNLFPPHRPRLFFLSSFSRTLCSSSLFFSLHSPALPFSVSLSAICSNQLKDSSIRTCKKKEGRGRRAGWALNEMKYGKILRGKKKNNKSGIVAATREGEERQRICQQCCENGCFSLSISCKSVSAFFFFSFFFPGTDYERRQRCQDLASFTESLTVFWKCR